MLKCCIATTPLQRADREPDDGCMTASRLHTRTPSQSRPAIISPWIALGKVTPTPVFNMISTSWKSQGYGSGLVYPSIRHPFPSCLHSGPLQTTRLIIASLDIRLHSYRVTHQPLHIQLSQWSFLLTPRTRKSLPHVEATGRCADSTPAPRIKWPTFSSGPCCHEVFRSLAAQRHRFCGGTVSGR
jgi:hypothetical protein